LVQNCPNKSQKKSHFSGKRASLLNHKEGLR
jgi:hypothetical protein